MMLRLLKLDRHTLMSSCTKLCDTKNIKKNFPKLETNVEGIVKDKRVTWRACFS